MFSIKTKTTAAVASLAFAGILASAVGASAQTSQLTNGPNGMQPNSLSSKTTAGKTPSRMMMKKKPMTMRRHTSYNGGRPLTVRPRVARLAPAVIEAPAAVVNTGPGTLVTGPLGFGSNIVGLPFRGLNAIFPATGDIGTNPLVLIGAPLHAIGDIAQLPFRIIGAPFGGTTISTY